MDLNLTDTQKQHYINVAEEKGWYQSLIEYQINVFGEGIKKEKIIKKIKDYKLEKYIMLFGQVSEKLLFPRINESDYLFLCLKSGKGFNLTIPAKFQTYLNFDRPIVAYADGEVLNLINKNYLGLAVKYGKLKDLKNCLEGLLHINKREYKKISSNVCKFKKNYLMDVIISRLNFFLKIYN